MKIRTQFIITMILFSAMLLFFFTSAIITQRKLERLDEQRNLAHRLERGTTDLSYLSSAYLLHRETQQRVRWNTEYSSFSNDLSRLTPEDPEQQELVNNITENLERMKAVFTDITASLERMPRDQGPGAVPARIQVSWSRIAVQSRAMLSDASRLSRLLQGQADRLMDRRTNLIFSLMGLFVVFLLFYYVLIYRRTLRAISALRTGTRIIGAGNLEYTLTPKHNDEVGELFHAVNRMTASLREVTASKAAFEKEVSGRKRAEEEVSAIARFPSENPHPVLRLNSDGLILFANAASAPVLDQWRTTVGGQAPAPWPDTTRGALISQSGTTVELGCGDRTYGVFVAPVPEAGYVNLYTSDITDRKRAEMALETARTEAVNEKSRLEAVMQALPVGMALVDARGGNIRANTAYEQVWGNPRPPVRTVADYAEYEAWWPDTGQPVQPTDWASAQAVQQKRRVIGQVLQIKRFDGTRAFVLNSAAPILDAEGEVVGAAVAIQDITDLRNAQEALRRSEALYRAIGESIDYGVWVCTPHGRNTYTSESFLKMVGLTQGQYSDFGWGAVLHPDDADRTIAAWKECVRTGSNWDIEHRFRGVDGQWHDILARGVPVKDERGEVLCWAGINLDISRLKRAEAALRQHNVELEQRVTERTEDLAQAIQILERQAQQLRTLTAELTLAEQRERRRLADVLHDDLQQLLVATRLRAHMLGRAEDTEIRQGSQEIVELIEEALAATRSLTGELSPPSLRNGDLLPALELLTGWMQQKHKFTVRLAEPAAPAPLLSEDHAVLVYQCVRELLLNTVKYARVEAADVTVTQDSAGLTLTVADAGVGFDPSSLRVTGGTEGGFGLLGIRERLESVGGRLEIASTPGEGSRFTLSIPLLPVPETAPVVRPPGVLVPARRPTRVLIVDDHALVRRGFATLLAGEPDLVVVGEAADGQMAIELTRQLAPDVILMDISMPVLDGIEATRAIHAEFPEVRVIGLSMFEVADQPEAMRQAGAVGYLSKSDSAEVLLAAIRSGGAPAT